ncbi:MAG: Transcription factor TFIIIB component B [Pleopsidium flavum]|nr:MAG: Transcription factor TFIIIB component B [Pleopsidium flavum]
MSTFGSSVINKSGKKFAPKAPNRRPGVPSSTQSSARASVERQRHSQTPQPSTNKPSQAGSPAPQISKPANTRPALIPSGTSNVHPVEEATTLIPIPTRKTQLSSSSNHNQVQPREVQQPSEPLPSSQEHVGGPHHSVTKRGEVQPLSQDGATPAKGASDGSHGGVLGRSTDAGGITTPSTDPVAVAFVQIPALGQDHGLPIEPAAKRRRINTDSLEGGPTDNQETVTSSSILVPTTETDDHATQAAESELAQSQTADTKKKRKSAKARGKQRLEDAAADIVADATRSSTKKKGGGRPGRRRQPTPENAEAVQIAPSLVKMADLCKDLRTGKKSKRETQLQEMDQKEVDRKERERRGLTEERQSNPPDTADELGGGVEAEQAQVQQNGHLVPQTRLRNGVIEVDPDSLVLDRHAHAAQNAVELKVLEESALTRRVTAGSWMKREKNESWNEEFTDKFYQGLRMFGTDFEMISKMFPGRTRRSIKLKFCKEEKNDKERIKGTLLGPREAVDMVKFSEMTNTEYLDPEEFRRELEEDRRHLEEQQAREKEAHDELVRQKEAEVAAESAAVGGESSAKENEAQGDEIGTTAAVPGKRGRKPSGKKKASRGKQKVVGGTVEVLATIE